MSGSPPILRVNGRPLTLDAALACLVPPQDEARLLRCLVDRCLVEEELESRGIGIDPADLQREMDDFRRSRRLFSARQTRVWLEEHGLCHLRLEAHLAWRAARRCLLDEVTGAVVGEAYYTDPEAFDVARVARLTFLEAARAEEAAAVALDRHRFLALGAEEFAAGGSPPEFLHLRRGELTPSLAQSLFESNCREVVGPVEQQGARHLYLVLEIRRARLRDPERTAIEEARFEEWLAARRKEAEVEWL